MARDLPPLNSLRAFEATARLGHAGQAADELNVTASAVSHQLKALEHWLGQPLFERRGRRLHPTDGARRLQPLLSRAFDLIETAAQQAAGESVAGEIRLAASPAVAARWLTPRLGAFQRQFPGLSITLDPIYPGRMQYPAHVDVLIHFGSGDWEGKWVHDLRAVSFYPVGSPALVAASPGGFGLGDLKKVTLLHDDQGAAWGRWLSAAGAEGLSDGGGMRFFSADLALAAAEAGGGLAMGDDWLTLDSLSEGRLVRPFDLAVPVADRYFVVVEPQKVKQPKVSAFLDWVFDAVA